MMQIRTATEKDIPEILRLLYLSRGDQSIPKTIEYWNWKHLQNPFGPSPVLLAEDDHKIIGIRTMMHWQWQRGDEIFKTLRAVDTTTHPDHQGKGIFTKLTLAMVDFAKNEGIDFIFNTPNEKSRPGYLKMGWKNAGRVEVGFKLMLGMDKPEPKFDENMDPNSSLSGLTHLHNQSLSKSGNYFTPKSDTYLRWRYKNNPVISYTIIEEENVFLAMYVKKGKFGELRIAECISDFSHKSVRLINDRIQRMSLDKGVRLITCSPQTMKKLGQSFFALPIGPIMAVREICSQPFGVKKDYFAAIGDLELF